jgi:hypothetical protein
MKQSEHDAAVVRLWLELPAKEREGNMALSRFHAWLLTHHRELLGGGGDSYQRLKSVLRNYISDSQA